MVTASLINKLYNGNKAVSNISFSTNENEIFGFLGPDGAGKTTILRIMATLLVPDSGTMHINGLHSVHDYKALRQILGYMPGRFSLYHDLTVEENLTFFASIFGTTVKENYHLIKDIYSHIEPFKNRPAGKLSGGMKQKLALSCALIHKPKLLILDEPTTGVDAVSRKEFWHMLKNLRQSGITIVVSTPYMDEAAQCDRVALIQNGSLLAIGTPNEITMSYKHQLWALRCENVYELKSKLSEMPYCHSVYLFGHSVHLALNEAINKNELEKHVQALTNLKIEIEEIKPNIEDCFMELMNRKLGN